MERKYLTTIEAAELLALSPRTLEKWRLTGEGPPYFKLGRRVVYEVGELEKWTKVQQRRSTSDSADSGAG